MSHSRVTSLERPRAFVVLVRREIVVGRGQGRRGRRARARERETRATRAEDAWRTNDDGFDARARSKASKASRASHASSSSASDVESEWGERKVGAALARGRVDAYGLRGTFTVVFSRTSTGTMAFVEDVTLRTTNDDNERRGIDARSQSGGAKWRTWDRDWYGDAREDERDGAHLGTMATAIRFGATFKDEREWVKSGGRAKLLGRGMEAKSARARFGIAAPSAEASVGGRRGRNERPSRRLKANSTAPTCSTSVFAISAAIDGRVGGRVFVDESTGLAWRAEFYHQRGVEQWTFEGWERVEIGDGVEVAVPRTARRVHAEGQVTTYVTESTTLSEATSDYFQTPRERAEWARPISWLLENNPDGVEIDACRGEGGHFLVKPRVETADGSRFADDSWFVLDTASTALAIAPHVADAAKMTSFGSMSITGVAAPLEGALRLGHKLRLGSFVMGDPIFMEQNLDGAVRVPNNERLGGVLGCPSFAHAVLSIRAPMRVPGSRDAPKITVKVTEPAMYSPSAEVSRAWMPLTFISGVPYVELSYTIANDGFQGVTDQVMERKGLFKLSIGTGGVGVILSAKVASEADVANRTRALTPGGIMSGPGESSGRLQRIGDEIVTGRIETLRFKGFECKNVRAVLHLDGDPPDVDVSPHADGAICADAFRGCELIIDLTNARIAVVPP